MDRLSILGSRIRERRTHFGLSQADLAAMIDSGQSHVSEWENAKRAPGADSIFKLIEVLETTPDYLFGITPDPDKPAQPDTLTDQERELLAAFRQLPNRQQDFMKIVQALSEE